MVMFCGSLLRAFEIINNLVNFSESPNIKTNYREFLVSDFIFRLNIKNFRSQCRYVMFKEISQFLINFNYFSYDIRLLEICRRTRGGEKMLIMLIIEIFFCTILDELVLHKFGDSMPESIAYREFVVIPMYILLEKQ